MENEYYVYIEKYNAMYGPVTLGKAYVVYNMTPDSIILKKIVGEYDNLLKEIKE